MFNKKLFCLFLILFSCTPLEFFEIVDDYVDSTEECAGTSYQTEYQETGIFRNKENKIYETIVDYEDITDRLTSKFTDKDIAQLASIAIDTYKENGYLSADEIYDLEFKKFHVVVTHTDDEFAYLHKTKIYLEDREKALDISNDYAAFVSVKKFCWDDTDANFTIVIRSTYLNADVLTHELGHIVNFYEFGYTDTKHENSKVWFELSGFDSINGKVLLNYEKITGLNAVEGGTVAP